MGIDRAMSRELSGSRPAYRRGGTSRQLTRKIRQPQIDCFDDRLDIDHAANDAPPPRRPSLPNGPGAKAKAEKLQRSLSRIGTVLQRGPSYLWNGTHQRLIEVLPEDPQYRENAHMISETIKRWDQGKP